MASIRDVHREEHRLLIEERRRLRIEQQRLKAAWTRDPANGIIRERLREEIYGRYSLPLDADHWILVDDPCKALTISGRQPDRPPDEVAYESVRMWAAQVFAPFADEWPFAQWSAEGSVFCRTLFPLPVGKQALQSAITRWSPTTPAPVADMMPFAGDEYAYLILRIPIRTSHVTMFGLAQPDDDGNERVFRLSGCQFLLSSANPYATTKDSDGAQMKRVVGLARQWWMKRMSGERVRIDGRRPGTRTWSEEYFREEMPRVYQQLKGEFDRLPTATEVYHKMGISKSTWYDYQKAWGFAFPPTG